MEKCREGKDKKEGKRGRGGKVKGKKNDGRKTLKTQLFSKCLTLGAPVPTLPPDLGQIGTCMYTMDMPMAATSKNLHISATV